MAINELKIQLGVFLWCISISLFGQIQKDPDSLLQVLEQTEDPFQSAALQLEISKILERRDIGRSREFAFEALQFNSDSIRAEAANQIGRSYFYQNQLDSATAYFANSIAYFQSLELQAKASSVSVSLGAAQLRGGAYKKAIATLIEGVKYFEETGDSVNIGKCYNNIASAFGELGDIKKSISYGSSALYIFKKYGMTPYQAVTLPNLAGQYLKLGDTTKAKNYYLEAEELARKNNDQFGLARIYNNLGNMYLETNQQKAEDYLTQSLNIKKRTKNNDGIATLYNNLGYLNLKKGKAQSAIPYFKNALEHGQGTNASTIYNNLSEAYESLGNYKEALKYSDLKYRQNDSIMALEYQKSIAEMSAKYDSEKKQKEILTLQNSNLQTDIKRKQNRNLLYGALGILAISLIIAYSYIKNSTKKRIIAEQKQELESQKVETLLNEIELVGIDSMIEGQEKERQRIAEDLHDGLGAKLSALKLFTEDVKEDNEELYRKIKGILDESYDDLRNIALQKNASAAIDKGLIPAVNKMAQQLQSTEKLQVEVTNIDLRRKIKDFIELQLFRILQELLTNTIKHAKATNVSIQFSEEEESLNVVYEDDGRGFDPESQKKGQGLINIQNRLQKIGGGFTVDSNPGDGLTVIINVPI